jgi:hypothetical protein
LVPRVEKPIIEAEPREPPPRSKQPFEYAFIDIRYLDAKPAGVQLIRVYYWKAFRGRFSPVL